MNDLDELGKVKNEINTDIKRIKKDILEEANTMDEKVKKENREDVTNLRDVIFDNVKF